MYRSHRVHCKLVGSKNTRSHLQLGVSHHCSWLNCSFGGRVMSHRVFLNAIFRFMDGQGKHRSTVEFCGCFYEKPTPWLQQLLLLKGCKLSFVWTGEVWMFTVTIYSWHIVVGSKNHIQQGLGGLCQHCFGQFFGSGGAFRWMEKWVTWVLTPRCVLKRMAWDMFWGGTDVLFLELCPPQVGYSKNCR